MSTHGRSADSDAPVCAYDGKPMCPYGTPDCERPCVIPSIVTCGHMDPDGCRCDR